MSYRPLPLDGPYREIGPIFIRAHGDDGYTDVHRWPAKIDPIKRVFRACNSSEEIVDARVGCTGPDGLIAELFSHQDVDSLQVRSLTYGCFTFKVERH